MIIAVKFIMICHSRWSISIHAQIIKSLFLKWVPWNIGGFIEINSVLAVEGGLFLFFWFLDVEETLHSHPRVITLV